MRKLMKGQGRSPHVMITDKLRHPWIIPLQGQREGIGVDRHPHAVIPNGWHDTVGDACRIIGLSFRPD